MPTPSRFFSFSRISRPCSLLWPSAALLFALALVGCATSQPVDIQAPIPKSAITDAVRSESDRADTDEKFARWVTDFKASARAQGISDATLHAAFDDVRFIPRVIALDRSQPEFNRPVWGYLDSALSRQRIALGQEKLHQSGSEYVALVERYSVPMEVLVAIWGIESNYGSNLGDISTIDALSTLGFEGRRSDWARAQLFAALKILQSGDVDRSQLIGSWAGAMGQTQFLPSAYLNHAVDADGDGRRDIWKSVPDVMASTANYLAHSGWVSGQPWGLEVRLPLGFDYARADADVRQPTTSWLSEGLSAMNGAPLPAMEDCSILLPAGARGPAFLVGTNFRTILRYNNATSYALAVSLLAQRLANGQAVQAAWPRDLQPLSHSQLLALQTSLNSRGFDTGTPDGLMGPATQRGVREYQHSLGIPADGYPTLELLQNLR
jgi:lytic murein transglycosylase